MSSVSILGSSRLVSLFSSVLCPLSILCLMITKIHRKLIETIDSDVVFGYLIANLVVKGVLSLELRPFFLLQQLRPRRCLSLIVVVDASRAKLGLI